VSSVAAQGAFAGVRADLVGEVQYLDARSHLLWPQVAQDAQVRLAVPAVAGQYLVPQTEHLRLTAALQP
jgi:hypothetical protein